MNLDFLKTRRLIEVDVLNNQSPDDFFQLFKKVKSNFDHCYFFESLSIPKHQDRFHTIGFSPIITITGRVSTLSIDGDPKFIEMMGANPITSDVNPYDELSRLILDFNLPQHFGGLIGFSSYEMCNYTTSNIDIKEHEDFPPFIYGLYLDGLILDVETGIVKYYSMNGDRSKAIDNLTYTDGPLNIVSLGDNIDEAKFKDTVLRTKAKIESGHSFQAEVGFKSRYDIDGDKIAIYAKLRNVNPSPYMFYVKTNDLELIGASPEILVSSHKRYVLTTPTAGTIGRGCTEAEDTKLARELLTDPKEVAEHNMLVDLHRNDISKVCQSGSVKVTDLMYLIKFSHVQHIVSNIHGFQKKECSAFDVLASILPGGVVSGTPKIETIKIIDDNETEPRGPYGGAVGRFSLSGDCAFALPIRSIFCNGNDCFIQTSAGIVYDSIPSKEFAEVLKKLAGMKKVLAELIDENTTD